MYTQSFSVPDDEGGKAAGLKAVAKPLSEAEQALQAQFDARIVKLFIEMIQAGEIEITG